MAHYYFLLAFVWLALAASVCRTKTVDRIVLISLVVYASLFSGLRWYSDVDYGPYSGMFDANPDLARFGPKSVQALHGEPGYLLVTAIFKSLSLEFHAMVLFMAIIAISLKAYVADQHTKCASLCLALYFCIHFITIEFIQIRWGLASGLILLACHFLQRSRVLAAQLCFALAVGFHYFALVFWAGALLLRLKREPVFLAAVATMTLMGLMFGTSLLNPEGQFQRELYIVRRLLSYLGNPTSQVGLLSNLRVAMYLALIYVYGSLVTGRHGNPEFVFLRRMATLALGGAVAFEFLPIFYFRAVVLADFFALLSLLKLCEIQDTLEFQVPLTVGLTVLFSAWFGFDVYNNFAGYRILEYSTWIDARLF
ncbi:MAG: EpsG family protein [Candidatus Wallbacteria bacterium]|nr:EpsG family protein [Candidatus Wallbacteria bacterium]